ncbi:VanZ family protein [Anditalea andensis]|uniref:VanZ family protein n=1 Tax=Anditalea andensis TaxID=1048983 RepID=UPI00054FF3E8|nr:VanZ family protein [Anditalea andensis]
MRNRFIPAIVWTLLLLVGLLTPGEQLPDVPNTIGLDKIVHLVLFMVLSFLWARAFIAKENKEVKKRKFIPIYLVFTLIFAILVEYMQRMVPGRAFDYLDILFNVLGVVAGTILFAYLHKNKSILV